jgi:hypothetical protein
MAKKRSKRPSPLAADTVPNPPRSTLSLSDALAAPQAQRIIPIALALLTLLLSIWTFDAKLSLSGDNTEFITLARSMVQGHGLSYINEIVPKAATKYPFGLPLLLAPLEWLFPGEWVPMKWLVVLSLAAAVALVYVWIKAHLGPVAGLIVGLLCATMPLLQNYGHQVMSEVPYLGVSVLALYLLERGLRHPGLGLDNTALWGGFAALLLAYYLRSVGLVLAAALILSLAMQRDWRRALVLGAAFFVCWLPWTLRNRAVGGGGVYFKQLVMVNPYNPDAGLIDLAGLFERLYINFWSYAEVRLPVGFWPGQDADLGLWASLAFVALAIYAAVLCLRRGEHLLPLVYAAAFLFTVAVWPWTGERFLIPLVPLALFFAAYGASDAWIRLEKRGFKPVALTVLAAALVLVTYTHIRGLGGVARSAAMDYPPQWKNYYAAARWIGANTPPDAVVICRKSYWMYIVSSRQSQVYAFKEPQILLEDLEKLGTDYVVVDQLGFSSTYDFLIPAIQRYPERFKLLWQQPGPDTYIFRFLPSGSG